RAYKDAGIDPRTVDYIEAHGTGTVLGDPIEAEALGRVVGRGRPADRPALLGAIKTNVGHMESAAGAASMAKVVLALQHDKLPPSINYAGPSPFIDFDANRLKVIDTATDWPRYGGYALAGVSSFGFCGANSHLVGREVLARDGVGRETQPQPTAVAPATGEAEAPVFESHSLRFDDFGNIIPDPTEFEEESYELPGVTDEALRLKEVALEELAAQEESEPTKPLIPLAVSAFLTSRKKSAAAELADWMESPEGQGASLVRCSLMRCPAWNRRAFGTRGIRYWTSWPIGTATASRQGRTGAPTRLASSSTCRRLARRYPAVTSWEVLSGSTSWRVAIQAVSAAVLRASRRSSMSPAISRSSSSGSLVHAR